MKYHRVSTGCAGQTFLTLTTDLQSLTGTAGNDTFAGNDTTLTTGDAINGGNGTDTLSVTMANSSAYNAAPTLTSVEKVQVAELGSSTATVNLIYSTGVTEVANRLSGQNVTFSNLQQAATVTADGTTAGTTIATFKNTLANGTADAINLAVTNGATAAFQVGAVDQTNTFETLNIASNGATKNTITGITDNAASPNNYGGVKSVVASGAADLAITLAGGGTTPSFDGSSATGAQTVTWGGNFTTIKTGSGNDVIDASAGSFFGSTNPKTVDGGTGSNTLVLAESVSNLASNSTTGIQHSVSNIATVQENVTVANGTSGNNTTSVALSIDASYFPNSTIYGKLTNNDTVATTNSTGEDAGLTLTNLGAAQKVQVSAVIATQGSATGSPAGTNDTTLSVAQKVTSGASDSITVELINPNTNTTATTPVANKLTTLTVDAGADSGATETLNLVALNPSFVAAGATTTTVGSTVTTITASTTTNLVASGSGGLSIGTVDLKNPLGTATQNIDASAMTGAFTLGSAGTAGVENVAVSVKGGSGTNKYYFLDTIGSTDVITGGAGADTLYVKDSSTAATIAPTTTGVETLNIQTVSGGAKTFSLANTTGVTTVNLTNAATSTSSVQGYGTTVSGINGQTVNFVTMAAGGGTAATFASSTTNLRAATGVTNVTAVIKGDGTAASNPTIATNAGQLTITDSNVAATTGYYVDESATVAGTGLTGDAALTKVVITGGGLKSATATDVSKFTLAASAVAGVTAISTVDATAWAGNLDISGAGLSSGATVTAGSGRNTITTSAAQLAVGALVIDGGDG